MIATMTMTTTTTTVRAVPVRGAPVRGRCARGCGVTTRATTRDAGRVRAAEATTAALRAAALFACFPAFAEDAAAVATSGEISPFAGVVDISVLALLAYFAKLGNEKAARESASKTKVGRNNGKKK